MANPMLIALDYDGTYTADPDFWDLFIEAARVAKHKVVCVTMRYPTEPVPELPIDILYTSRKAKSSVITPDIWIDDRPGYIYQDSF